MHVRNIFLFSPSALQIHFLWEWRRGSHAISLNSLSLSLIHHIHVISQVCGNDDARKLKIGGGEGEKKGSTRWWRKWGENRRIEGWGKWRVFWGGRRRKTGGGGRIIIYIAE